MGKLSDKLNTLKESDTLAMHMPGHKRNEAYVSDVFLKDITEIDGFDNLHFPEEVIKDMESDAASIYKANRAYVSVNGSTGMLLSAVLASSKTYGGKILVAMNCHVSVWHGIELSGCEVVTFNPDNDGLPFMGMVNPDTIETKLQSDSSIKTVVITSPTYEGIVSDTKAIHAICRQYGAVLITDAAHGAHLIKDGFGSDFPSGDIVVTSIHKTLNAPTQTALMLQYSDMISEEMLRHYVDVFESSSPSYVLLEGVERCLDTIKDEKNFDLWLNALGEFKKDVSGLKNLKLLDIPSMDRSKIVLLGDGTKLKAILDEASIICEAYFPTHVIAMTGIGDNSSSLKRFSEAILKADELVSGPEARTFAAVRSTEPVLEYKISDTIAMAKEDVDISSAEGRIAGEFVFAYPPGIPILIPGEKITSERIETIVGFEGKLYQGHKAVTDNKIKCLSGC